MKKILALLLVALTFSGCVTLYDEQKKKYDKEIKNYEYEGNTIRYTCDEMRVTVSYLAEDKVDLYYSLYKDGVYKNPFPPDLYTVFQVTVENRSEEVLMFNPRLSWFYPEIGQARASRDYAGIYTDLSVLKADRLAERMEGVKDTCLDYAVSVGPGEKASGLLVFHRERPNRGGLVLESIYLGSEAKRLAFVLKGL